MAASSVAGRLFLIILIAVAGVGMALPMFTNFEEAYGAILNTFDPSVRGGDEDVMEAVGTALKQLWEQNLLMTFMVPCHDYFADVIVIVF
eukprot:m.7602 g.7602  ORF g.7602 m.7602 type:complete len:90 (-) comp2863_c0_seq2:1585-1854(-)